MNWQRKKTETSDCQRKCQVSGTHLYPVGTRHKCLFMIMQLIAQNFQKLIYRKITIDRPGGIHFFSTHNFWIIHKRTKTKTYSERVKIFLSEYAFIIVPWQVVRKLCVEKKWTPPGLSIEILRQSKNLIFFPNQVLELHYDQNWITFKLSWAFIQKKSPLRSQSR